MKIRRSTKIWLYKAIHMLLIVALLVPLLPRAGFAQPLPLQKESGVSVDEAFELLNAEIESFLPASEHPFGLAGQQASSFFDPSLGVPTSPWEMLSNAPQTGANGAPMGGGDNGDGSFLPQPLDPNAQNSALLESIMPMLVDMPGTESEKTAEEGMGRQDKGDKTVQLPPEAPVGTTPTPEALAIQTSEVSETSEVFPKISESRLYLPFVARQHVSSSEPDVMTFEGGVYHSPDEQLMVVVPVQLVDEPVRLSYTSGLASLRGAAALSEEVAESRALFALEAHQVSDKEPVAWVRRPLELRLRYDDAGMAEQQERALRLYAYNALTDEWVGLPTAIDEQANLAVAQTLSFTVFALAPMMLGATEDPCAIGVELVADTKFPFQNAPVDSNNDPIAEGTFLPMTSFSDNFPNYLGTEVYVSGTDTTGDLQKTDPTQVQPTEAKDEVKMVFPEGDVEHINAGSVPPDDVTDKFPPNEMVSLPDGTQSEERMTERTVNIELKHEAHNLNDPQWGSTGYYLIRKDITDPVILNFYSYHDGEGGVNLYITAYDHCAVKQIALTYSNDTDPGGSTMFEYLDSETDGLGLYRAEIKLPTTGTNTYTVLVEDMADYDGPNSVEATYSEQASNSEGFGMAEFSNKCNFQCGCQATCGVIGDPINTAYGNFTTLAKDVSIPGIGDTDIELQRTYNSLGAGRYEAFIGEPREPIGIFGLAWSSPQQFEIEVVERLPLVGAGIKVNYPDGHSVRYSGVSGTMMPLTPGEVNEIVRSGNTFVLTDKDTLNEYHFDVIVDATSPVNRAPLVKKVDPNGNTITYTPGTYGPTQISNSAGRTINLTYNGAGLITNITGPEGLSLTYGYTGLLLTSFTDERGKTTTYQYDGSGYLTAINTPKGHSSIQLTYNADGRVASQTVGAAEAYTFTYDDANFKRTITDSEGNSEIHQYDADYRLLSVQDGRGFTESYTYYNAQDLRETLTDKEGRTWSYTYDTRSNLLRTDGPLGWYLEFTYDPQNDRPLTMTDAEGRTTNFAYDGAGNLTSITNADGKPMSITYDRGLPETITDFNGHTISNTYDGAGDLTQVQNGEGEALAMAYDGLGRMSSMTTHEGSNFSFVYDEKSNLLKSLSGPLGYSMGYTYDANGNLESETDALGNPTSYEYDESENLKTITDALSGKMSFTYDSMNNLLTMTDELLRVTSYKYDETYNLTEISAPESRKTSLTYDGMANLKSITDGEGRVTTLDYDDLDRLTDITDALGGVTTIDYDKVGNILSINDANGHVTSYVYDVLDRLTDETNAESEVTRYEYDNNSNLIKVTDAELNATDLTYDNANRLTSIKNAENEVVTFAYDSLGNILDLVQPNNVPIHWQYDQLYRPTTLIQNYQPSGANDSETNVTYDFKYDLNGNLTEVTDPLNNKSQFEYDKLNRLTKDTNALTDPVVYEYDKVDNLTKVTDRRGNDTILTYDGANRLTQVTDARSGSSIYAYDRVDNLTSYTDENNHTTTLVYDKLNRLEKVTNPETHAIQLAYDAVGNVTQFTDARSASTILEYDDVNRLIKATDARTGVTQLLYDEVGNVTQVTDANTNVTKIAYDRAYRTTSITDAENYVTSFEYDENGNITKVIDGNSNQTVVEYDKLDRITGVTNAESEKTSYTYDAIGNLIDIIEQDGVTKRYGYDAIYRLTSVTLNHGGSGSATDSDILYQYGYDANGNLTSISDALTHLTSFQYDELNRMTRETNPLNKTWDYQYDPADNLTQRIDGNNNTTTYAYYDDDQLQTIQYDDGTSVAFSYDENNNLTQMVDSLGTTSLAYDELNRLSNVNDALGRSLGYGYDPVGNLTSMTYPHGGTVHYGYFKNDWLQTVTDTAGGLTIYERNGVGQMTRTLLANGAVSTSTYDKANRLLSITHNEDGGELISSYRYTLNDVGLRTRAEIEYARPWDKAVTEEYSYDGLRRLTGVSDNLGFSAAYEYDKAGNRTGWSANDDQMTQVANDAFDITYSYNEANQLLTEQRGNQRTTYTYDGNGNRTNKESAQTGHPYTYGTDYRYDREDRLTNAINYRVNDSVQAGHRRNKDETMLAYDGIGRRMNKEYNQHDNAGRSAMTEYVFDGLDVVAEYPVAEQGEPTGRNNHRNEFYYNDNMQIVSQRRFPNGVEAQTYTYHYDGRMNVVSLSEETNRAWVHYQYDAYGQQLPEWGNAPHPEHRDHNAYTVTGKEWDENTGTYYFGVRHYDPDASVWVTQDIYRGRLRKPATLQRYAYVHGTPTTLIDLYGLDADFSYNADTNTITVSTTIEIYDHEDSLSDDEMNEIANTWQEGILNEWSNQTHRGRDVVFEVDVFVGDQNCDSGDNCVAVTNDFTGTVCEGLRSCVSGGNRGAWEPFESYEPHKRMWLAAHEFGHLCGLGDDYTEENGKTSAKPGHEGHMMAEWYGSVAQHEIDDMMPLNIDLGITIDSAAEVAGGFIGERVDAAKEVVGDVGSKIGQGLNDIGNAIKFWD